MRMGEALPPFPLRLLDLWSPLSLCFLSSFSFSLTTFLSDSAAQCPRERIGGCKTRDIWLTRDRSQGRLLGRAM
jgi:hypothetical protein